MKHSLFLMVAALLLSACGTAGHSPPIAAEAPPAAAEKPITWVLVLIDLNHTTPALTVEGSYDRMDKCFIKREQYIPGYPKPGTQGLCIQTVSTP